MGGKSITVQNDASEGRKIVVADIFIRSAPKAELALMKRIIKDVGLVSVETIDAVSFKINDKEEKFNMVLTRAVRSDNLQELEERIKNLRDVERIATFVSV